MKDKLILFWTCAALLIGLTGCAPAKPNEKNLMADLPLSSAYSTYFGADEAIESLSIEKSKSEGDDQYRIWCTVQSSDQSGDYTKHIVVIYTLYDTGGWIIDSVYTDSSQWLTTTLKAGVSAAHIEQALIELNLTIGNDSWYVSEGDELSVSILTQDTDLAGKTDKITAEVTLRSGPVMASGQIDLKFNWMQGYPTERWTLVGAPDTTGLTLGYAPRQQLQPDEAQIKAEVASTTFNLGYSNPVSITISEEEMINFAASPLVVHTSDYAAYQETRYMDIQSMGDAQFTKTDEFRALTQHMQNWHNHTTKGLYQVANYTFLLPKGAVTFQISVTAYYGYNESGTWDYLGLITGVQEIDANLLGRWKGTFQSGSAIYEMELQFDSVDDAGRYTGVFTISKPPSDEIGSRAIFAQFNTHSSTVNVMNASSEWLIKPPSGFGGAFVQNNWSFSPDGNSLMGFGENQELKRIP